MRTPDPIAPRRARRIGRARLAVIVGLPLLVLLLLAAGPLAAQSPAPVDATLEAPRSPAPPRVGLVTMSPGVEYWSRFGHNAILVDDGRRRTLYNFGFFDFEQEDFLLRFLRGRMLYQLVALPMELDLRGYAADGRGVRLQWLALEPDQARELAASLAVNAQPENAEYRYDYFTENCSTKVRDALDRALGGQLRQALSGRSHGYTFRDEARRLSAPLPWLYLGIHLGLGPFVDKPTSLWEEAYVPQRLHDALADARRTDGQPLVSSSVELLPQALPLPPCSPPDWRGRFLAIGATIALALAFALRSSARPTTRRAATVFLGLLWLLCAAIGSGLLALWGLTDHVAAWGNENALLFSPLAIALLPCLGRLWRGEPLPRWARNLVMALAFSAGLALFLKFLPFRIQSNGDWIALMLPVHVALAWRLRA
jgi:hypothetical protein